MSSSDTLENNSQPDAVQAADLSHDHEGHNHEGHDHQHEQPQGPAFNPECTRELVLDVPAEDVTKAYRTVVGNYRKYAKIPGFRAGKVPETVVKRRFAEEIRKDVLDGLLPERFSKAVVELGIKPVGQPQVLELTIEDGEPLHVKALFEYLPDFSIEGYQSVTVEKPSAEITEEDYNQQIERLLDSSATIEPVEEDRALVDGDWAQISYKGELEGASEAEPIVGDDALIEIGGKDTVEAFTAALRGAKPGQELKAEVLYPADSGEARLAGKTVSYEVTVKAIKRRVVPELTDDFARQLGRYQSLAELESNVREHLTFNKRRSVADDTKDRLFAALAERFPFAVPETMVQEQIDARLDRGLRALAAQGMNSEQMRQLNFAHLRTVQRDGALAEVKAYLLMDRIADEEKVTIDEEELSEQLHLLALQSREPVETLRARLTEDSGMDRIREQLRREKTANLLYERLPA